jgi:RHS repeat-associated protein
MENTVAIEKPPLGDFFGDRRRRRRNRRVSPYRVGEKWLPLRQSASGPHVDYNARLYDPALGRFLSVDPLIAHPGSTQSINPYSYVENNPLNKTDPTGMADQCADSDDSCNPPPATKPKPKPTATGSHIPGTRTRVNNVVTLTMGPGSMMTVASPRQDTKAPNSTGNTNVNDGTSLSNKQQTSAGGNSTTDGDSGKALKYGLMHAIKKSGAKGTYWQDIYSGKTEGGVNDWKKIAEATTGELDFFSQLSNSDYRMYFDLRSDTSDYQTFLDKTQLIGSLNVMAATALKEITGNAINNTVNFPIQVGLDILTRKSLDAVAPGAGEAYEYGKTMSEFSHTMMKSMEESRRYGPDIICSATHCGLGN